MRAGFIVANEYIIRSIKNIVFQEIDSEPIDICHAMASVYNLSYKRNRLYKRYFKRLIRRYKFKFNLLSHLINGNDKVTIYDFLISIYMKKNIKKHNGIDGINFLINKIPDSGFFAIVDFTGLIDILGLDKNIKEEELLKFLYAEVGIKYIMGKSMGWKKSNQFIGRINYGEKIKDIINSFMELKNYVDRNKKGCDVMKKPVYLTTNKGKFEEAKYIFNEKYGFDIDVKEPDFEVLEIQAESCIDVVKFSVKYACEKLGRPCIKSDSGLYVDALGGLPGPYNHYFDKQIGVDKFLKLMKNEKNRKARLEDCFAYCEPGKEPIVFFGGGTGKISFNARGNLGRWHDKFYIPAGETKTLSELREIDRDYEAKFWGNAIFDFAEWYKKNKNNN